MNEKYKLSEVKLPKEISEIHLGFSSMKYFVGMLALANAPRLIYLSRIKSGL